MKTAAEFKKAAKAAQAPAGGDPTAPIGTQGWSQIPCTNPTDEMKRLGRGLQVVNGMLVDAQYRVKELQMSKTDLQDKIKKFINEKDGKARASDEGRLKVRLTDQEYEINELRMRLAKLGGM